MHETLVTMRDYLNKVVERIESHIPADNVFSIAHNNWAYPSLTREDLLAEARSLLDLIEENESDDLGDSEKRVRDFLPQIKFLYETTVPNIWGNPGTSVHGYLSTLQALRKILTVALVKDDRAEIVSKLRKLTSQVRSMEAQINGLEPRTSNLVSMVSRIESAHDAADQLPTDLASLTEARSKIEEFVRDATKDHGHIEALRGKADELDAKLKQSAEEARQVLARCETAYSASTSVGLAAAFSERSKELSGSMWIWVGGLIVALAAGSYFGSAQLHNLSDLFSKPEVSTSVVLLNLMLSLLSVGAPVWFAWLSTKQIGQRFRLAEDYAFKASISRAYEGFRREAARIDKDMEARLLSSALTRLDELPLRLVETDTHGSPWHELASSDLVKDAVRSVPGFAGQVKDLAAKAISNVVPNKPKMAPASADNEVAT